MKQQEFKCRLLFTCCTLNMGTNTMQPLTLVCNDDKPKFYTVELDLTGLKILTVEIGMDWAMLIAYYIYRYWSFYTGEAVMRFINKSRQRL